MSFERELKAWEKWREEGEPGDCPMCGAGPTDPHGTKYCYGESPDAGRRPVSLGVPASDESES